MGDISVAIASIPVDASLKGRKGSMEQITGLTNAKAIDDGEGICFDIATSTGSMTYCIAQADLGRLILFFTGAAKAMSEVRDLGDEHPVADVFPIPLTALDLRQGGSPGTSLLAMNVSGFWLGFEGRADQLAIELRAAAERATDLAVPAGRHIN